MSSRGEQTSKEIIRINRCLEEAYEENNRLFFFVFIDYFRNEFLLDQPISFFLFTIHPTLFSRSVENIFHISFLIKVGYI